MKSPKTEKQSANKRGKVQIKHWKHQKSKPHKKLETQGSRGGHHTTPTPDRSNELTKTRGKAETKHTDTNDETRNRWGGTAGEMTERKQYWQTGGDEHAWGGRAQETLKGQKRARNHNMRHLQSWTMTTWLSSSERFALEKPATSVITWQLTHQRAPSWPDKRSFRFSCVTVRQNHRNQLKHISVREPRYWTAPRQHWRCESFSSVSTQGPSRAAALCMGKP